MIGLLDHLSQASHIVAGMGITFGEALDIVKAAHEPPTEPAAIDKVIYGVDFAAGRRSDNGLA